MSDISVIVAPSTTAPPILKVTPSTTVPIVKATTSAAPQPGCGDDELTVIFDVYCEPVLPDAPTCADKSSACCTANYDYAKSAYSCMASYAPSCKNIAEYLSAFDAGLAECTITKTSSSSRSATTSSKSSSKTSSSTSTTKAPIVPDVPETTASAKSASIIRQSATTPASPSATATAKSAGGKVEVWMRTPAVVAMVGGMAMFFLGGSF